MNRVIVLLASAFSLLFLARLGMVGALQLPFPYDLTFETPNLTTIELIRAGRNPYDPALYAAPPFQLTLYTPLYHHLVALLPTSAENPYLAGRCVSALSMLAAAAGLFVVCGRRTPPALAWLCFGVFFALWPVALNTVFLKNDPLALACSVATVLVLHHGRRWRFMPAACALLGLAAIAAKQSYVAALVTAAIYLAWVDRRKALQLLGWSAGLGLLGALCAQWLWGSGFWFSTIAALGQHVTLAQATAVIASAYRQPLLLGLLVLSAVLGWQAVRTEGWAALRASPLALYAVASLAVFLMTVGKIGSQTNYVMEPALAQLLWCVHRIAPSWPGWARAHPLPAAAFGLCCALELVVAEPSDYAFFTPETRDGRLAAMAAIEREFEALRLPADPLVLVPETHLLGRALSARTALNDPLLYALLWRDGILPVAGMIASLDARAYDAILLPDDVGTVGVGMPRVVLVAIDRNYRVVRRGAGQLFFLRRAPR